MPPVSRMIRGACTRLVPTDTGVFWTGCSLFHPVPDSCPRTEISLSALAKIKNDSLASRILVGNV